MLWIATIPGVALMVGMQFAVESPRWLSKVCSLLYWWTGVMFFDIACVYMNIFYIYLIPCFLSFTGYRYLRLIFFWYHWEYTPSENLFTYVIYLSTNIALGLT